MSRKPIDQSTADIIHEFCGRKQRLPLLARLRATLARRFHRIMAHHYRCRLSRLCAHNGNIREAKYLVSQLTYHEQEQ